ncbi:MAG: hypothetical protein RLW62_05630, partial [Gammaproteobacteria bacterium]
CSSDLPSMSATMSKRPEGARHGAEQIVGRPALTEPTIGPLPCEARASTHRRAAVLQALLRSFSRAELQAAGAAAP